MAKKTVTPSTETLEPRIYEIGYLLSPAVRDEDLETRVSELKETLAKFGATVISEGAPEFIDLAYEMTRVIDNKNVRFNQAYFGWVKIEIEPKGIALVKEFMDANIGIIRYLLILSTRENTVIGKKPLGKMIKGERKALTSDETGEAKEEAAPAAAPEAELAPEAVEAELDADIKEMVKEA
ncbi:MAG: Ribosomal protein [Patescibacteria group bacterium]|nr:Ribosomal protein [Patescibacteria group bacterium]